MILGSFHEPLLGTRQPPLDRRQRHPARRSDLGQLHLGDEPQRERHALVVGKRVEHAVGGAHRFVRLALRARNRHLGDVLGREEPDPAPAPAPADAPARREHRQRRDPAAQRRGVLQAADALEHAHEDVLDDVRNFGIDAERARHQPLDQRFVTLDQHRARRAIAAVEGRDQLGIVVIRSRPAIEGMRAGAHLTREGHRNRHITPHDLSPLGPKAAHAAAGNLSRSPTVNMSKRR